jgi:hypothetical protein
MLVVVACQYGRDPSVNLVSSFRSGCNVRYSVTLRILPRRCGVLCVRFWYPGVTSCLCAAMAVLFQAVLGVLRVMC